MVSLTSKLSSSYTGREYFASSYEYNWRLKGGVVMERGKQLQCDLSVKFDKEKAIKATEKEWKVLSNTLFSPLLRTRPSDKAEFVLQNKYYLLHKTNDKEQQYNLHSYDITSG